MLSTHINKDHVDDIRATLLDARLCHQAWWVLIGTPQNRKSIVAVCERYFQFFDPVRFALFTTFAVKLASLFGTRSDEITLRSLPLAQRDAEFAGLWNKGRRLHRYRSKVIAHRDRAVSSKDFAKETGFTYRDLATLLDATVSLFDRIADKISVQRVPPLSSKEGVLALVGDLCRAKDI